MPFKEIEEALENFLRPNLKITIAERIKFYSLKQFNGKSVMDYMVRLRQGSQYCEFDKLKTSADPVAEMLMVALIAGLANENAQDRVLDKIQASSDSLTLEQIVPYIQQFEGRRDFMKSSCTTPNDEEIHHQQGKAQRNVKLVNNYRFCGKTHGPRKCPAYGKVCSKCSKQNHFAAVCRSKTDQSAPVLNIEDQEIDDIFFVQQTLPVSCDIKEVHETVLINGNVARMQIDTGAIVSVILSRMWREWNQLKLSKSQKRLQAYDSHTMKTLGKLVTILEKDKVFYPVELVMVESGKCFGPLGRDVQKDFNDKIELHSVVTNTQVEPLPAIKGVIGRMQLVEGAEDVSCKARPTSVTRQGPSRTGSLRAAWHYLQAGR